MEMDMQLPTARNTSGSRSRLQNDFDDIQFIGKGAYGQVVKARGRVDGKIYAIKKVKIDYQTDNVLEQKVFDEVHHLADLDHDNVVRYFDSWIENVNDSDDCEGISDEDEEDLNDADDGYDDGLIVVFKQSGSSSDRSKHDKDDSTTVDKLTSSSNTSDSDDSGTSKYGLLCIKMEFCEHGTLHESINHGRIDNISGWKFLREIINGLDYIHRRDIIHRDLNPKNIFISSNGSAKIGDFGVATFDMLNGDTIDTNTVHPSANIYRRQKSQLSGKAGTALYAAPEVETPTATTKYTYDTSADLYSLGFIAFEIFYPAIKTEMEKAEIFKELKIHSYPDGFDLVKMSGQVIIIENLLVHDARSRYTASYLLNPENRLLPYEQMEEKHLQKMKIAVRDPKSKERSILLKEIFDAPDDTGSPNESEFGVLVPKSDASRKVSEMKLLDAFRNACNIHGAVEIALPPVDTVENKTDIVKFIDDNGRKMALTDDHMVPVAQYITKARVSDAKLFCTQPVYKRSGNIPQTNRILQFSFHIVTPKRNVISMAETLCFLQKFVLSCTNGTGKGYRISINHNAVICGVLDMCGVPKNVKASLLGSSLLATIRYRVIDYRRMSITQVLSEKMIRIFSMKGTPLSIRHKIKSEFGRIDDGLSSVFQELDNVIKTAKSMGLKLPIAVIPNFTLAQNSTGLVFRLTRQKTQNQASLVATGGEFASLLSTYWNRGDGQSVARSRTRIKSKDYPFWISVKVLIDRIISAEADSTDVGCLERPRAFNCDVVVHYDAKRQQEGVNLVRKWWENGVRAKLTEDNPSKIQLKDYKRLGVSYVVSIDNECGRDMVTIIDLRIGIKAKEVCLLTNVVKKLGRTTQRLELDKEMERSPTPDIEPYI